jgi:hypothetical protein
MEASHLRYILFMLDSRINQHDGIVFANYNDCKQYAVDAITDEYCTKFVIGSFVLNVNHKEMLIDHVETFGNKGDVKNVNQLNLFK